MAGGERSGMRERFDRFLRHGTVISSDRPLGRVFSVVRETWPLTADPQETPPETEVIASDRSASEAADVARDAASAYARFGFHKPSGAWWSADGERFHRFAVRARPRHRTALLVGAGLAGVAALALLGRGRKVDAKA